MNERERPKPLSDDFSSNFSYTMYVCMYDVVTTQSDPYRLARCTAVRVCFFGQSQVPWPHASLHTNADYQTGS